MENENRNIDRRTLIKAGAAGALGLASLALFEPHAAYAKDIDPVYIDENTADTYARNERVREKWEEIKRQAEAEGREVFSSSKCQ